MAQNKRIVITGAGGLVGRHVLRAWREKHELHALVRSLPPDPLPGVTYYAVDLAAPWDAAMLPPSIDAVFHLAQSSKMREFPAGAPDIFAVNTQATALLLDYARRAGATHFILASTGGLYAPGAEALTEASPVAIADDDPLSYYFTSKYAAELLLKNYAAHMHTVALRPFFIYGPGQRSDMLIPRLIHRIENGLPVALQGEGGIRINPLHVADACRALEATLSLFGARLFNLAGSDVVSIREIGSLIGERLGIAPTFTVTADTPRHIVGSNALMREHLLASCRSFSEGLQGMIPTAAQESEDETL